MDSTFKVFDFHRMFIGEAPPVFLLEIVFRTLVMYLYAVVLLRVLGKRGMGQMSMLELAIIISFGSAVGDPMIYGDVPITHGMVAITVVSISQIWLEKLINSNKKVEALLEGRPNPVVTEGVIQWDCMKKDNISREDLFRSLRGKDVEQLGQVEKAYFETSGRISVFFRSPRQTRPGLTLKPDEEISKEDILHTGDQLPEAAHYSCMQCGHTIERQQGETLQRCEVCKKDEWIRATK